MHIINLREINWLAHDDLSLTTRLVAWIRLHDFWQSVYFHPSGESQNGNQTGASVYFIRLRSRRGVEEFAEWAIEERRYPVRDARLVSEGAVRRRLEG